MKLEFKSPGLELWVKKSWLTFQLQVTEKSGLESSNFLRKILPVCLTKFKNKWEINVKFCCHYRKLEPYHCGDSEFLLKKLSACNNPRLCSTRCHKNGNHLCLCFCNSLDNLDIYNHTVRIYGTIECRVLGEIPEILKFGICCWIQSAI